MSPFFCFCFFFFQSKKSIIFCYIAGNCLPTVLSVIDHFEITWRLTIVKVPWIWMRACSCCLMLTGTSRGDAKEKVLELIFHKTADFWKYSRKSKISLKKCACLRNNGFLKTLVGLQFFQRYLEVNNKESNLACRALRLEDNITTNYTN